MEAGLIIHLVNKWKHKSSDGTMEFQMHKNWCSVAMLLKFEHKIGEPFDLDAAMKEAGWVRAC